MLNQIEPALDHLGNSQTIRIAKEATVGDLLLETCSKEKAKDVAEWPYASAQEIRHVTDGFPLPSQQRRGIDLRRTLLSIDMNACDIYRRPTNFFRMLYQ